MTIGTAQDAIFEYRKDFAKDPAGAVLNLELPDDIKNDDAARR